jgi:hypothetical protein
MADERTENDLLFDLVKTLHGQVLTDEQLDAVKARVDDIVTAGRAMRAVPLGNADEPFVTFVPLDTRPQR